MDFSAKLHHFSSKVPLFSATPRRGGKERYSKRRVRGRNRTPAPGAFRVVSAGSREQFKIGKQQCAIGKILSRLLLRRRLRRTSFGQSTFSFSAMEKNARGNPCPFRTSIYLGSGSRNEAWAEGKESAGIFLENNALKSNPSPCEGENETQ